MDRVNLVLAQGYEVIGDLPEAEQYLQGGPRGHAR